METVEVDSSSDVPALQPQTSREADHPSIQRALDEILRNEQDGAMFSSHTLHTSAVE